MEHKNLKDIKGSGFKVPQNYFENFEETILSHSILKDKVSDSGFSMPEDYLENVENKIFTRLSKEEPTKVIALINRKSIIYVSSIAAALALMFSLIDFNPAIDINSIDTASIESYLANEEFDTNELATLFDDTEFLDETFNTINFSEDAIEDYVIDNLELNDLYIE